MKSFQDTLAEAMRRAEAQAPQPKRNKLAEAIGSGVGVAIIAAIVIGGSALLLWAAWLLLRFVFPMLPEVSFWKACALVAVFWLAKQFFKLWKG